MVWCVKQPLFVAQVLCCKKSESAEGVEWSSWMKVWWLERWNVR